MEKNPNNGSPDPQDPEKLVSPASIDINQIQSAVSISLSKEVNIFDVDAQQSPAIKRIFEMNSRMRLQDQSTEVPKDLNPNPKQLITKGSGYFGLLKKSQKKGSTSEQNSPSNKLRINLPLSQKGDDSEAEQPSSVTPPSNQSKNKFGFLGKKLRSNLSTFMKGSEEEEDPVFEDFGFELNNVLIEFPFGIISPYGYFKKAWNFIMAILILYISLAVPVRLSFSRNPKMFEANRSTDYEDGWLPIDIITDIIIFFDMIINFISAYENMAGLLISKRREIAKAYIKGWFGVDLISLFPVNRNIFSLSHLDFEDPHFNMTNYRIWRIVRLIKLIKMLKLYDTIDRFFSSITLNIDKMKILKFAAFIFFFIHNTACLWNICAELQIGESWHFLENDQEHSIWEYYITATYYALTVLLTVGYGNIYATTATEKVLTIVWMFFGIIVYTYIFSSMTISFARLNAKMTAKEERDLFYRQWTMTFKLPYETLDTILNTVGGSTLFQNTDKMEVINLSSKVVADLPKGLYIDIYNFIFKDILEKVDFFRHRPRHFIIKVIPLLKQSHFEKGDYIYSMGDPAFEVFFIVKGRVLSKCQDKYGKERIQVYVEGSVFGEVDIIMKRNRTATLRVEDHCELWKINKKEFLGLLKEFPAIKEEVEHLVKIKELYRQPMTQSPDLKQEYNNMLNNNKLTSEHLYGGSKIFNALSNKMIRKIQKGSYFNSSTIKNTYESLDFEPDLPSPDLFGSGLDSPPLENRKSEKSSDESSTERSDEENENNKKASSLKELPNPENEENNMKKSGGQKRKSLGDKGNSLFKIQKVNESVTTSDKSLSKKRRSLAQWEINFQAKKKLLEELKLKGININDTSEIDRILQKDDIASKIKENSGNKLQQIDSMGESMIEKVERMLLALDNYEETLDQIMDIYDISSSSTEPDLRR